MAFCNEKLRLEYLQLLTLVNNSDSCSPIFSKVLFFVWVAKRNFKLGTLWCIPEIFIKNEIFDQIDLSSVSSLIFGHLNKTYLSTRQSDEVLFDHSNGLLSIINSCIKLRKLELHLFSNTILVKSHWFTSINTDIIRQLISLDVRVDEYKHPEFLTIIAKRCRHLQIFKYSIAYISNATIRRRCKKCACEQHKYTRVSDVVQG